MARVLSLAPHGRESVRVFGAGTRGGGAKAALIRWGDRMTPPSDLRRVEE